MVFLRAGMAPGRGGLMESVTRKAPVVWVLQAAEGPHADFWPKLDAVRCKMGPRLQLRPGSGN